MSTRLSFAQRLAFAISDEPPFDKPGASETLRTYLDDSVAGGGYDGRHFETYGADSTPFTITPADLVAVTCLSMEISARTRSGFTPRHALAIERAGGHITELLQSLPDDRQLHTLSPSEFAAWLGSGSPAWRLWDFLREEIGTPRVATYKLLARKRPHLLPIRDSATTAALSSTAAWWEPWWQAFQESPEIVDRLEELRDEADAPDLSLLRVADVVIWMRRR